MPPHLTNVTFELSDACGHKDFGQTLPPMKLQSNINYKVLVFTELVPALLLLWHIPHTDTQT